MQAHSDGNEATGPVTADVWAEHSVWPQDPGFSRALANGGVTALQILPGSANLFGGRSVVLKNVYARTMQGMKFPGAPYGLKMACGENPKRVYGGKGRQPSTRMGNIAVDRATWAQAQEYDRRWTKYEKDGGEPPARNIAMDTLRGVLDGEIRVQNHCYRADEMAIVMDMAKEFGYKVSAFHHAVEAYKIGDLLKANGTCAAVWADWYGFKMESYDGIHENLALLHKAGACVMIHSDDANGIQRLNQEVAKALAAGRRAGIQVSDEMAWTWLSLNPAKALGHRRGDRIAEARQDGRRRAVERQSPERLFAAREGLGRRRDAVRRERSAAAPGQRFRARPARHGRRQVKALLLAAAALIAAPAAAQTIAITGGTVAIGDGSAPIPNGTVVVRDGRIVAAGANVAVPAGAQVVDARGKWVTAGITAGIGSLGLVDAGGVQESNDSGSRQSPYNAAIDVSVAINPDAVMIANERVGGVTRAIVAPDAGGSIWAGQGAVIDLGADPDRRSRARACSSMSNWARTARAARAAAAPPPMPRCTTRWRRPPTIAAAPAASTAAARMRS